MVLDYKQELALVTGLLEAYGLDLEDAGLVASVICHSDFTGVYSHGLSRLTRYMRQYDKGALDPHAQVTKILDDQAVAVFDGANGSGIVTMNRAYEDTLIKARRFGIAFATGRRNANIGCGSYHGFRAAQDDMICLCGCNTYAFTSPFGGADRMIGTDPIIAAIPAGKEHPIVIDISTTFVAMGKIQAAEREGQAIPQEWAKDYDGLPTTDPSKAFSLSPIASHKGYALAVLVDALSTLMSGACYGSDIGLFSKLEPENTGFFLILIDPSRFMPIQDFKANVDRYIRMMKDSRKAPGVEEIFLPGEIEQRKLMENMEKGISVSPALEKELLELARGLKGLEATESFKELVDRFA